MKKYIYLPVFLVFSLLGNAQKNNSTAAQTMVEAQKEVQKAEEEYQKIQEELQKNREERRELQTELEEARTELREARLAETDADRSANPVSVERYEVTANPVYEDMSMGQQHGYSVFLPNTETSGLGNLFTKTVDGEFKSYMKNYKVDKFRKRKGELFFDNILIEEISSTPIDLFVDFAETDTGVTMKTYFNLGDRFLNFGNRSDAAENAKNILDHFARYIRKDNLESTLDNQEKRVKELEKDLKDYKKDIADAKDDMNEAETTIAESMNKMDVAQSELDNLKLQLEQTRLYLSNVE